MAEQQINTSLWRELWYEYRSEFFFGIVLMVCVALSFWLGAYIPEDVFECVIIPIQYIASTLVCLCGALLVFRHHEGMLIRKSWAVVLLIWGTIDIILLILRFGLNISAIGSTPDNPLYNASVSLGNILAWLLFVYPTQALRPGWLTWQRALLFTAPVIVLGVIDYYAEPSLLPVIMIYPAILFFLLCAHVRQYRLWCENNYSSMDNINAQWIVRYLIILALLGISFYFISFCYIPNRMFTQQWLLFFMLAYSTEQIVFRKDPWENVVKTSERMANHTSNEIIAPREEMDTSESVGDTDVRKLEQWMDSEKPYLNPEFQLTDLRAVLPMNRTYLSQFINMHYGCSFFQWVCRYRVEEAKRLLESNPDMKLSDISAYCGFSSPAVFSRAFTRSAGISPREWNRLRAR